MGHTVEVSNRALALSCLADGTQTVLRDKNRGVSWRLAERTRGCRRAADGQFLPLGQGTAVRLQEGGIRQEFAVGEERMTFLWRLLPDGVEITLSFESEQTLRSAALPGSFVPEGLPLTLAIPVMQGLLFDGRGEPFEERLGYGGHFALSMAMLGYLTERSGLLVSVESRADWAGVVGKGTEGIPYAYVEQLASLGSMRYARTVRLYPADAGLVSLCKQYRRRVRARGDWKPWAEKIAERPAVSRLFGALMAFIGYNHSDVDYVDGCRRLRRMGFDRIFLYPVRFNAFSRHFEMGGDPPIHLSDGAVRAIREIGCDVAPWTWVVEALDDGAGWIERGFLRDAAGRKIPHWRIDEFQWHLCCTPFQAEFVKQSYEGPMAEMTWAHFDVNATAGPRECHALDHPWHRGRPLDRQQDQLFLRQLLGPETNGDRVISSEGFRDSLADTYDIGTTKLLPAWGESLFWTVPMTMLVYHDSLVHDWWEVHNYNAAGGFDHVARWGRKCDGFARRKAAMDALYGCPPNVFPFGRQYRWLDFEARKTESYTVRLTDSPVQEALAAALPVARLHRRIGRLELLSHAFLSEDGAVQATEYADGTRVCANLGDEARAVEAAGELPARSWKVF